MKQIITSLFILTLLVSTGITKPKIEHYNNWIFGKSAGITFSTSDGEPKTFDIGEDFSFTEGTSSISDDKGDLLYYLYLSSTSGKSKIQSIKTIL